MRVPSRSSLPMSRMLLPTLNSSFHCSHRQISLPLPYSSSSFDVQEQMLINLPREI